MRAVTCSGLSVQKKSDIRLFLALRLWISEKRYCDSRSVAEAAGQIGATPEQLSYFCSEVLGKTFRQLRKELRIREAERLLRRCPGMTLSELGRSVGIPDRSDFRKQFIDVAGQSPGEWVLKRRKRRK